MPRKLRLFALLPFATLMALALVALGPLLRVRLGLIRSSRIGHFIDNVEAYVCRIKAGMDARPPRSVDVFFFEDKICNVEIAEGWRRCLRIFPFQNLAYATMRVLEKLPIVGRRHLIDADEMSFFPVAAERAIHRYRGHIGLSPEARALGASFASDVARGKPIVCVHVRDASYLRETHPGTDYSYHDYRDWSVNDLSLVVDALTKLGYFVVRMGAVVDSPLPFSGPDVFDYATSSLRSDRLDVAIGAQCAFWLGSASGLLDIPFEYRRPVVVLNHICPLLPHEPRLTLYDNSIWIFKGFWREVDGRRIGFREILDSGAGGLSRTQDFRDAGIRLTDNTPEEIRDAALEMAARLAGTWAGTAEDEALQKRFWNLWGPEAWEHAKAANVRVGARYLAQHAALLPD